MHEMELFFITNAKKRFSSIDNPSGSPETAFFEWKWTMENTILQILSNAETSQ